MLAHQDVCAHLTQGCCAGCPQAFKVYNVKGEILAGPVSVVDFFGQSVLGSFSDAACKPSFFIPSLCCQLFSISHQ